MHHHHQPISVTSVDEGAISFAFSDATLIMLGLMGAEGKLPEKENGLKEEDAAAVYAEENGDTCLVIHLRNQNCA